MAASHCQKSTIVRTMRRVSFAAIRAGFGVAERLAPGLGAAYAERLWWQLPPTPRGRMPGTPATRFQLKVGASAVTGHSWGDADGETVYLMHGWGGATTQFAGFVPALVAAGFRVVGFDAPSHGESGPGRWGAGRASIPELADALTAVVAAHGPAYAVIAHSLGCAAVGVAVRDGLAVKRLVFIAPAARPTAYTYEFAKRLGFGERIRSRMVRRVEARVGLPMDYFDVPEMAGQVAVPPVLVMHDVADRETRYADGEAIAEAWPGSRMVSTTGLGHNRILRDEQVIAQTLSHLTAGS